MDSETINAMFALSGVVLGGVGLPLLMVGLDKLGRMRRMRKLEKYLKLRYGK